jgi:prepilin-type N-terminal cleavage/methylation domain-containing protein
MRFLTSSRGFTLIEMITVLALIMIGSAMAIPVTMSWVQNVRGDSGMITTMTFLEAARNRAVAERRNMRLSFPAANVMVVERLEVPGPAVTEVARLILEMGQQFDRGVGVPDTPDNFGGVGAVNFTGVAPVMFTSDGSFIDNQGDVTNGTIFIRNPGAVESQRAVTIWGVTGMLRTWKWSGTWGE